MLVRADLKSFLQRYGNVLHGNGFRGKEWEFRHIIGTLAVGIEVCENIRLLRIVNGKSVDYNIRSNVAGITEIVLTLVASRNYGNIRLRVR